MMSETPLEERPLHDLLEGLLISQRQDIHAYSGGHLNEANLYRPPKKGANRTTWKSSDKPMPVLLKKSEIPPSKKKYTDEEAKMKDAILSFSMGTKGSLPPLPPGQGKLSRGAVKGPVRVESKDSLPSQGSYSKADDGVLVEEIRAPDTLLNRSKFHKPQGWAEEDFKHEQSSHNREEGFGTVKDRNLARLKHQFIPGYMEAVTRKDQFVKMKEFEADVLRKQDALETNVLSGVKAVEHLEAKLRQDLDQLQYHGYGPNFHRLQIYSNVFEDAIHESPTFGYILRTIKKEYDDYVASLLDGQTAKHKVLYDQVEQLSARGTSNPQVLHEQSTQVHNMEYYGKQLLEENERLRKEVQEEIELSNLPQAVPSKKTHLTRDEPVLELAEQIEEARANILEKLDQMNALRHKLRTEYVPSSVCTHVEQCIKDTEVEIQKLTSQKEFFDRGVNEMETDLQETIENADTTEKDSKRVWKHVSAVKSLNKNGRQTSEFANSDEEETEDKWNWYIS